MQADGVPVVAAYATGRLEGGGVHACFYCRDCDQFHWHGCDDGDRAWPGSHRWAHCWRRSSPLVGRGVFVWIVGDLPDWCRDADGRVKRRLSPAEARRLEMEAVP